MYLKTFRMLPLRWDADERFVATIGCIAVTILVVFAGVCHQFNARFAAHFDLEMGPTGWGSYVGIGTLAITYLVFMLGGAWLLAMEPREWKACVLLLVSGLVAFFYFTIAALYLADFFHITPSVM